ncbi:MAG: flagellar motor protein MotB [Elusimicrobiales bacterium]|nr:flagellar motor protein MotB [Elusimicrobiales bacterium]
MDKRLRGMIPEDDESVAQVGHPAPAWMVNYADLMTELVCFFVILYALSAALNKDVQAAAKEVEEMIEAGEVAGDVEMSKEGLKISLEEQGKFSFFESGQSELTEEMKQTLDKMLEVIKKVIEKNEIIIEGHTDDVPIKTKEFSSNWDLSTARATEVVKYFIGKNVPPAKMAAIGYGQHRPIVPNISHENRRKNRRVVFFIKTSSGKFQNAASYEKNKEKKEKKSQPR